MNYVCVLVVLFAGLALADTDKADKKPAGGKVEVFSDEVFKLQKLEDEPPTTQGTSGKVRYVDRSQAPINIQQRRKWLQECSVFEGNPKAHRKCYSQKRKASEDRVDAQVKKVEDAQSQPLRTAPKLYLEQEKRNPSWDESEEKGID